MSQEYSLYHQKWDKIHLTWHAAQVNCNMEYNLFRRIVYNAIKIWGKYGNFTYSEIYNCGNSAQCCTASDICVSFQSRNHSDIFMFDGKGGVLAHAFFPGNGYLSGDVHLDIEENWNTHFLLSVIIHEIGHSLGIKHSSSFNSVMHRIYKPLKTKDIYTDDKNAISTLYPSVVAEIFTPTYDYWKPILICILNILMLF